MEARNRSLEDWYGKIERGEIKLPRFQRFESWDRQRRASLMETVISNLPLGITLVLEVGEKEKFISRYLATAPETNSRVLEHLLDGQQRLTSLWRMLHNNYKYETYFIYLKEFDRQSNDERKDMSVYWRGRYYKKNGARYPRWCDDPAQVLARGLIPTDLLRPKDIQEEIDRWIDRAIEPMEPEDGDKDEWQKFFQFRQRLSDRIKDLRATIKHYNLPYLSLPTDTDKSIALTVFINMNTNSKPLSTYDIIVAEVEGVMGQSLHDLENELADQCPEVRRYADLSGLILTTSALLQGYVPSQRGAWDMDKREMVNRWDTMTRGLKRMAGFLRNEGVFDERRLPTSVVLPVIAAL